MTDPREVLYPLHETFSRNSRRKENNFNGLLTFTAGLMIGMDLTSKQIQEIKDVLKEMNKKEKA